ncbi:cutinase family protein [Mycobacterium hodleri]|uniref:Cutinase family protein n=2 Tax=Mycolicibacterium hodleri TaxID=49897 RepID=A0A502DUH2_9MYCO|nr:cutinase family protein [Mycolicibacterium hodleri]
MVALAALTMSVMSATAPEAAAEPCPDAEVIFARGTTELPGVGPVGEAFVDSVRARIGTKSVGVYAVDYPATTAFSTAIQGIADARNHILATAASCPDTKMVLGGFSQGAAVMGFVTASVVPDGVAPLDIPTPMPPEIADHVAAVVLFGKPSTRFMKAINDPDVVVGPNYTAKASELCVDNDLVCDAHGRSFSAHNQYVELGLVDQGAVFAVQRLQASWTADEAEPSTSTPEALSAPVQAVAQPQHTESTAETLPGPAPLPGPATFTQTSSGAPAA